MSDRKHYSQSARVERSGVALCATVVAEMGHIWRERPISDVGIDGDIEIVDFATDAATGRFLLVRIKSRGALDQDSSGRLRFRCNPADIEYWTHVGAPVLPPGAAPSSWPILAA